MNNLGKEQIEYIDALYYELERLDKQISRTEEEIINRLGNIEDYPKRIQNAIKQKKIVRDELNYLLKGENSNEDTTNVTNTEQV